jgi:hypothetical protein
MKNRLVSMVCVVVLLMAAGCATSPTTPEKGAVGTRYNFYLNVPDLKIEDTRPAMVSVNGQELVIQTTNETGESLEMKGTKIGKALAFSISGTEKGEARTAQFKGEMNTPDKAEGTVVFSVNNANKFSGKWKLSK